MSDDKVIRFNKRHTDWTGFTFSFEGYTYVVTGVRSPLRRTWNLLGSDGEETYATEEEILREALFKLVSKGIEVPK